MRLRFTIRDLLWLAALVAVCVAWWADRTKLAREGADDKVKIASRDVDLSKLRSWATFAAEKINNYEANFEKLRNLSDSLLQELADKRRDLRGETMLPRTEVPFDNMPIMRPPAKYLDQQSSPRQSPKIDP